MSNIGTIKWFSNAKGFGIIISEDCEGDIFVHYSEINVEGYKTLKAGQLVSFDAIEGPKGLHAANIHPISDLSTSQSDEDLSDESEPSDEPEPLDEAEPSEITELSENANNE